MTDHQFSGFDHSITDNDIRTKNIRGRIYRNRRIGDFLRKLGLNEGRNTGFPNARKALRENGSPDLEFEMDPSRQYLSVIIPIHKAFLDPKVSKGNAYQEKILKTLGEEGLTLTELAKAMGYRGITKNSEIPSILFPLKEGLPRIRIQENCGG
ncbi:MAG: hypothetical protein PUC46_07600 [Lachnospiraceae bacterium]|nr:hypothetical protein [Lachnospiraceae bacterium]